MNSTNATHLEDEGVFYTTLRSIFLEISPIQLTNYLASLSKEEITKIKTMLPENPQSITSEIRGRIKHILQTYFDPL